MLQLADRLAIDETLSLHGHLFDAGLLDRLDEYSIDAEEFSVHTPDLDDVFLALTGHASTQEIAQ